MDGVVSITSESTQVLATGSFITYCGEESRIHLHFNNEDIYLNIKFVDEEGKSSESDRKKEFEAVGEAEARLTLYNYKGALGTFLLQPMNFATIGGRELLFQYRVDDLYNSLSKLVFYTFYLGREVENGQD